MERIRHRSSTPLARLPDGTAVLLAARARTIPQLLWPDWAIRLTPAEGFLPGPFRASIAACLLLPGNPARTLRGALTVLHAYRSIVAVSQVIRALGEQGHDSVLAAVCHLAEYLDTRGSPIDYQRRREAISPEMITLGEWPDLCDQARGASRSSPPAAGRPPLPLPAAHRRRPGRSPPRPRVPLCG